MSSTEKKLKFRVVYFSSEDPEYPASQLNTVNPSTKGWMSLRFCDFPQELGFELLDGVSNIRQIQVLNHQSNIASKIELFVGMGEDYESATFKRLGYMSIDNNERSNYQARELKTVFVDSYGKYIKLLLNENHVNHLNNYNQVGIIALNLTGLVDHSDMKLHTPIAKMAGDKPLLAKPMNRNPYTDLSADINLDPHTAGKLRLLAEAKNQAVKNEDYLMAKQIKVVEQELKQLGSRLGQLELAKTEAVAAEDYDLAKDIKDQCDDLKKEIARKINAIEIPGVRLTTPAPTRAAVPRFAPAKDDDGYDDEIIVKKGGGGAPINVDDIPVGGGGKKVAKVETFHHPSFDEDVNDGGNDGYDMVDDVYSHNSAPLDGDDRPIRPKPVTDYNDRDPVIEENNEGPLGTGMPKESFPVGEHPLEGIPGFLDLPTPEPLSIKSREYCDQYGITKLVGEYRSRCLFSKSWNLREAMILKTEDLLKAEFMNDIINATPALCAILKQGVEDKMQQVMFTSMNLMESILKAVKSGRVPKSIVVPAFDHTITQLIEKLSDGNARQRECARKGLDMLAASSAVGPHAVSTHLVRPLPPKQKTAWRPIASRLEVLAALVSTYHLNAQSGLNMDQMLNFAKTAQAFTHSHNEVRDNAKKLVVAIHKEVGTGPLEPTLALLRKKQREEYEAAFIAEAKGEGASNHAPPAASHAPAAAKKGPAPSGGGGGGEKGGPGNGASPKRTDKSHQHAPHNPGGKVPTSQAKVESQSHGYDGQGNSNGEEKQDYSSCMFCGMSDKKWSENDLDLHYWKDCPLLISCPSCAQIVEIAGLPEHLLDECEAKDDYLPCDITGLAIRKAEFAGWKKSPLCVPAPENFMYCPLCLSTVEDSDQAWLNHLTKKCAKNARIQQAH